MNSTQALEWLYATQQFGLKFGLENIHRLLASLGDPQKRYRSIHVAGTNGKGSVCAMLEQILRDQGYRTGLYTSPHLVRFNERIRLNGREISDELVTAGLTRIRAIVTTWETHPTFFEIATALAFLHFAQEDVEIAIVETGLGGRLDSTNVLTPLVSVLTPISYDHEKWLGETLPEIAGEKAGIIKPDVPVVSTPQEPEVRRVLESAAKIQWADASLANVEIGILGPHQSANAALAFAALYASGLTWDRDLASQSLVQVSWPGRFQIVRDRFVLDGAHNPHAARALVTAWKTHYSDETAPLIFGMLQDKDASKTLAILEEIASEFYFVAVRSTRSADPELFLSGVTKPASTYDSLEKALAHLESAERLLITGSLFLVGEALALLNADVVPRASDQ